MSEVLTLAIAIKGVNDFTDSFNQARNEIGGLQGVVAGVGAGIASAGVAIAAAAVMAGVAFSKASITAASDFEREMVKVKAVSGATEEEFDALQTSARDLAKNTEFAFKDVSNSMIIFGKSGQNANDIMTLTAQSALLARASMTDLNTATMILDNAMDLYGFKTAEAARVSDIMTYAVINSDLTMEGLGDALSAIAPITTAAGISFEEVTAALSTLANSGMDVSTASSGLRLSLSQLLDPSTEAISTMTRLGLEFNTFTIEGENAKESLKSQIPILNALQSEQASLESSTKSINDEMAGINFTIGANNQQIQIHQEAINTISGMYSAWDDQIASLRSDMLGLQDSMSAFSLDMKKNNLEVMEIRQQADREGRDLTEQEQSRIKQLEEANDELTIQREKAGIQQEELGNNIKKLEADKAAQIKEAAASEISAIETLQASNLALGAQRDQLTLKLQENSIAQQQNSDQLALQEQKVKDLTAAMQNGVTGVVSLTEIIKQLETSGISSADMIELFGARGASAMLSLKSQGSDALGAFTTALTTSQGATQSTADIMSGTMDLSLQQTKKGWQDLEIEIGNMFIPVVKSVLPLLTSIIPKFEGILTILPSVATAINPLVTSLGSIVEMLMQGSPLMTMFGDSTSGLTPIFDQLAPVVDSVGSLLGQLAVPMEQLGKPMMALLPVVSGLIEVITAVFQPIMALMPAIQMLAGFVSSVLQVVLQAITPIFTALGDVLIGLTPLFGAVNNVIMALKPLLDSLAPIIGAILTPIIMELTGVLGMLTPVFEFVATVINEVVVPNISFLVAILVELMPIIMALILPTEALTLIFETLTPILEAFFPILEALLPLFTLFNDILEPFIPIIGQVVEVLTPLLIVLTYLLTPIGQIALLIMGVQLAIEGVVYLWDMWSDQMDTSVAAWIDLLTPVYDLFWDIYDIVMDVVDAITSAVDKASDLKDTVSGGIGGAISTAGDIIGFAEGTGEEGVPATGLYKLHKSEIVLNAGESAQYRQQLSAGNVSSKNMNIGNLNLTINANSESEGKAAAKGFLEELHSAIIRGDYEVV
ncbi:phage tail tape measure protein [Sulfuricurvum sp.]|uniref:phage tail tape measure protein n=1 Tax=Sulfuricurvum sp. TaxID=2025608 RepID=UPI0035689510